MFGLKGFELVESSEAGMLSQVAEADKSEGISSSSAGKPHPMNSTFQMAYLEGGMMCSPQSWRRHRLHQCARMLADGMPECGRIHHQPEVHPSPWRTR